MRGVLVGCKNDAAALVAERCVEGTAVIEKSEKSVRWAGDRRARVADNHDAVVRHDGHRVGDVRGRDAVEDAEDAYSFNSEGRI